MRLAVFDLDGTLFCKKAGVGRVPWHSGAGIVDATQPFVKAVKRVQALHFAGVRIAYLTGRGEHAREATCIQIRAAGLPAGELVMWDEPWTRTGYVTYKARELRRRKASLYVGDSVLDEEASKSAGVPFIEAFDWRHQADALERAVDLAQPDAAAEVAA